MTNGKNSFLQVVKLPNVRGRVRYISDPKRQENLYATFTNVESKYWTYLSKENQEDFRKSGTEGKCIEARELIIMLPPSLTQYDSDVLLKYFFAKFVEKYDVAVASALHHNKAKTNLHIHLIFSERQEFDVPERKIAARNLFYDENGKHVRTKKEILSERGEIRPGCRIVKKGEVYETNLFKPKNQEFKSKKFTEEMKYYYTDLINELVKDPAEKLKVFDKNSPYLPTRKIGKNNPKAEEIRIDNYLRQEWNHMVDRAVTEGVTEESPAGMESYGGPGSDGRRDRGRIVPGEEKRDHCAGSRINHEGGLEAGSVPKHPAESHRETERIHSVYERNPERRI